MLNKHIPIQYPRDTPPQLIVVVDTEEEFDWAKGPDSNSNSVNAIHEIYKAQDIFNEYGIQPCYVVDYPIAAETGSINILKSFLDAGLCEIGSHLHPWVSPPIEEKLSLSNMYPGNLSAELEFNKLSNLTRKIQESFGIDPDCYKAGRYGVGKNTTKIMQKLGYSIDLSICSAFDYSADGGPDFSEYDPDPYWFGPNNSMLEIPLSGAFVGIGGKYSSYIYNMGGYFEFLKVRGILSRLGIVDRLMLSPEGFGFEEHVKLTRHLYNLGVRTFTWNFHSPTVVPGMTMYTRSDNDVKKFLDSFRRYFDFFIEKLNGEFTTPSKIKKSLEILR